MKSFLLDRGKRPHPLPPEKTGQALSWPFDYAQGTRRGVTGCEVLELYLQKGKNEMEIFIICRLKFKYI